MIELRGIAFRIAAALQGVEEPESLGVDLWNQSPGTAAHLVKAVADGRSDAHAALAKVGGDPYVAVARAFFRSARSVTGQVPDRVTTDGHGSYPRAIRTTLGRPAGRASDGRVQEQRAGAGPSRRQGRIRCMQGFKSFASAGRFCRSHDELRDPLRPRTRHNQIVAAGRRRRLHLRRVAAALAILVAAQAEFVIRPVAPTLARALTEPS